MKNNFKNKLTDIGLNYKKEVLKIIICNLIVVLASAAVFFFLKEWVVLIVGLILCGIITYIFISSYSSRKKKILEDHEKEFVTIISYFQIFINNNFNVYKCLEKIVPYTSDWMNEKLTTLLKQIDDDKTVQPFVEFAKNFKNSIANNVMLLIYQMIDEGSSKNHMMQFTLLFEQINKKSQRNLIETKDKSLSNLTIFPLVGSGAITVLVIMGVLAVLQEMLNVI